VEAFWTRGVTVLQQLNTLFGNSASISGGKESSHHASYPEHGILPGTAIVGASIPVATGAAMALRMQGSDHVVLCFFGDGAANTGEFHEGLNLASILKAPVVFICENNSYAMTVPVSASMGVADVAVRAAGYGMPGEVVDGQDVMAVYAATQMAVLRARLGEGPALLECKTYRYVPHHPSFKENRPHEELDHWMRRDPIAILATHLKGLGCLDDAKITDMDEAIRQELDDAIRQAEATPPPEPEEVFSNLYAEPFESMGL
jgi:TPP-dependent pyruvate/acetoin dehydrogenase alpha subunit